MSITLHGPGAALFDVQGRCTTQRFTGLFRLRGDSARGADSLSARSLRQAGLC